MIENKFTSLSLSNIEPTGYIREQLELQMEGITLKLDENWPSVGNYSDWIGGSHISWERPPYWLDGLVPLSYLLNNKEGIDKANIWIEYILNSQKDNGDFGPTYRRADFDETLFWPKYVVLKTLISYYEATSNNDDRVILFMTKYFEFCKENYNTYTMKEWANARGGDLAYCIFWLYNKTKNEKLLKLIEIVNKQTLDWSDYFTDFPFVRPTKFYYDWNIIWKNSTRAVIYDILQFHFTHVVNVAMGIKQPIMEYKLTGDKKHLDAIYFALENLNKYHGQVNGMFSGDEHIAGLNPTQGTELCAVVEMMFSLQVLYEATGDNRFVDLLEKITYNALPATITEDFKGHQYVQQVNQVLCTVDERDWYNIANDSNIFGYEPNFGCCLANMHQGWPKFLKNAFMQQGDDIYVGAYMPLNITLKVKNIEIKIEEKTKYPFDNIVDFKFLCKTPVDFNFYIRIPSWCKNYKILINNVEIKNFCMDSGNVIISRLFTNLDKIQVVFDMKVNINNGLYNNGVYVTYGPIVYALKIDEERVIRKEGLKDFPNIEIYPKSSWNYAIEKNANFEIIKQDFGKQVFHKDKPAINIKTKGRKVKNWKIENNVAGNLPKSPLKANELDELEDIELIPYGCAKLRIGLFPWGDLNG